MKDNKLFGDSFLDKLITGGGTKNPEYNPKTKKGALEPPVLYNTNSGDFNEGLGTRWADTAYAMRYTGRELGFTNEDIERDAKLGISLSPYTTEDEYNKARANTQSAAEQTYNFLQQAGVGEVVLGTLEGFGNIYDGIVNSFTGDDFRISAYSKAMHEVKDKWNKMYEIYRENPDASWDFSDYGWWMSNAVSIMSTASLMLPAAGWSKGLSMLGRISKLNRLGRWATKGISRGIAKTTSNLATDTGKFSALKGIAGKSARIEQLIKSGGEITMTAALSRTGENMMEAKGVYDDIYARSVDNLQNMPDEEFNKFLDNNPKFKEMSKDEIAKAIAAESAKKTFYNDYWMLLMDIPQYKALGSLFGKIASRAPRASARIAAENVKRTMAGVPAEQLIKNNFLNKRINDLKYAFKNPKESFVALSLDEGVEEMYQGIQTEKGMEVATKYFNPSFTPRSIQSYLQDGSIWEQGFWGVIGGIAFPFIGDATRKTGRKAQGLWNKKHMTADDYEAWKRTEDEIAVNEINDVINRTNKFIEDIKLINESRNPYKFVIDPSTGKEIFKDGNLVEETIDDTQKELLREKALKNFIVDDVLMSVDNGTFELKKEILGSSEFDKYIADKGVKLNAIDKQLSKQVVNYMDNVSALYKTELQNINALVDTTNPFIERAAARNITRNKLQIDEYNNIIANIKTQIASQNTNSADFTAYREKTIYDVVQKQLQDIENKEKIINLRRANNDISESAAQQTIKILNAERTKLLDYVSANSTDGALDAVKQMLKKENVVESTNAFNDFIKDYKQALIDNTNQKLVTPPETITNFIQQLIETNIKRSYTEAQIPTTKNEYTELYDEFARSMDVMEQNKTKEYLDIVKNYLSSADNVEDAINNLINETIDNKEVKEAMKYLKYRYFNENADSMQGRGQFMINMAVDDIINTERKKRKDVERLAEEAKNDGIELPPAGTETGAGTNNGSSSTGEGTETGTTGTTGTVSLGSTAASPASEPISTVSHEPQSDDGVPDNVGDGAPNPFDDSSNPDDVLDGTYENPRLKADIDARDYVIHIGFNNPTKLDEITNALQNNNTVKLAEFVKEVTDYLLQAGYDEATSKSIAKSAIVNTINMYGGLNQKSAFGRLAQQLSINFKKHLKNKKANTPLLTDEQINEIVDKFLEEYAKVSNNPKLSDSRQVINLQSLFNYLIHTEGVDINTAIYIYNNISQYIATNTGEKYMFTGFSTPNGRMMSGKEFIDELEESKAQILSTRDQMHIFPIPTNERGKRYRQALLDAANGAPTTIIPSYSIDRIPYVDEKGQVKYREEKKMTHLEIHVLKEKGDKRGVKIGILRTVKWNADGTQCLPISHYSGFGNRMSINPDNSITLDNGKLFEALIERPDDESQQLFNDIIDYAIKVRQITDRLNKGIINQDQAKKEYATAMTDEVAEKINNNKYIKQLLESQAYKLTEEQNTDKKKAANLAGAISSILFYSNSTEFSDVINASTNTFAVDSNSMRERYEIYKDMVRDNYEHTFDLQDALANNEDMTARIKVNVSYYTKLNTILESQELKNIGDSAFQHDPTQKDYTPLIMVKNGHMIGEDGKDYGKADPNIADYSMGYIVYNDEKSGVKYVAYFKNAVDLNKSELKKHVTEHFVYLIQKQLTNINNAIHADTFNEIRDALEELFGSGGLFRFGSYFSTGDLFVSPSKDGRYITLQNYDRITKRVRKIITFYSTNANGGQSHAIAIYNQNGENPIYINSLTGNSKISEEQVRELLDYVNKEVFKNFQLNRSSIGYSKQLRSGGTPSLFTYSKERGFVLHLAGKDYKYNNYGDFLTTERGFTTNVYSDENGNFTTLEMNDKSVTIDTKVQENSGATTNTDVSDYLFDRNYKTVIDKKTGEKKQQIVRKTVDTEQLLELSGVDKKSIDTLLGKTNGVKIVSNKVQIYEDENVDGYLFFNPKDKKIYITKKGAQTLNGNPTNAIRLIIHENIHRYFNSNKFTNAERERIVKELRQVYDFVRTKLTEDYDNSNVNKAFYDSATAVLDITQSYEDEQTRMEEFLVECLTQKEFTEWLNNTEYGADADITNVNKKKKSILQKIMDVLLDLLGIKERNIKNNSILAREYVILSKGGLTTINSGLGGQSDTATTGTSDIAPITPSVEVTKQSSKSVTASQTNVVNTNTLDATANKIQKIRDIFGYRITRSENFAQNHTYYLDSKKVDTSVTQVIHGKQDLGDWGTPASLLGNTFDEAARTYFINHGVMPEDAKIPNVTEEERKELIEDLERLKQHLDKVHGKDKWRAVSEEFPIGGTVTIDGEVKTVAGTMDLIIYTDSGDIYIYDFKTKRRDITKKNFNPEIDGNIDENTLTGYKEQVNIYVQLLEQNFSELRGRVHTGSLIKSNPNYPAPNDRIKYRESPTEKNQLQVSVNGKEFVNIQDAGLWEAYDYPRLPENLDDNKNIIPVEYKEYKHPIGPMPDNTGPVGHVNDYIGTQEDADNITAGLDDIGSYLSDDEMTDAIEFDDISWAKTEQITNATSSVEIYAPAIKDGATDNAFGIRVVNNMNDFIQGFPVQHQGIIKQLLASNEINYLC